MKTNIAVAVILICVMAIGGMVDHYAEIDFSVVFWLLAALWVAGAYLYVRRDSK